jgi:hypothetical protein
MDVLAAHINRNTKSDKRRYDCCFAIAEEKLRKRRPLKPT